MVNHFVCHDYHLRTPPFTVLGTIVQFPGAWVPGVSYQVLPWLWGMKNSIGTWHGNVPGMVGSYGSNFATSSRYS